MFSWRKVVVFKWLKSIPTLKTPSECINLKFSYVPPQRICNPGNTLKTYLYLKSPDCWNDFISSRPYNGEHATCSSSGRFPIVWQESKHLTLHIPGISPGIAELLYARCCSLNDQLYWLNYSRSRLLRVRLLQHYYFSPILKFLRQFSLQHDSKLLSTRAAVNARQSGLKLF